MPKGARSRLLIACSSIFMAFYGKLLRKQFFCLNEKSIRRNVLAQLPRRYLSVQSELSKYLAGNRDTRWCWLAYDIRRILLLLVSLDARRRKENFCFLNYMRPVEICIWHGPLDDDERHPMRFGLHKVQEGCHSFPLKSRSV